MYTFELLCVISGAGQLSLAVRRSKNHKGREGDSGGGHFAPKLPLALGSGCADVHDLRPRSCRYVMVGKGSSTPAPPSALAVYFRVPVRSPSLAVTRTSPNEVTKRIRRRHRMRSFSARAEGIQNALFATRLGPLMHDDKLTREWGAHNQDDPERKARVVIRRRNMRTAYRRSLGQDGRARTAVESVVKGLWGDFDKENMSPNTPAGNDILMPNNHARRDDESPGIQARRENMSPRSQAHKGKRPWNSDADKKNRPSSNRRNVFHDF